MKIDNWFVGVVEETWDPMSAGRVRVRCFSYHSPNHELLPTENLIWAQCVLPVDNAGIGQVGSFAIGLKPGSWVLGFFRDGNDMQDPVVLGGFSGSAGNSINYQENLGYGDKSGAFKYHSGTNAFPADSSSFASVNGYSSGISGFMGSLVSGISGSNARPPGSFKTATEPIVLSGNGVEDLVNTAINELGVAEVPYASNKGPVAKYWDAVGWDGTGGSHPWCAAFVSWCVRESAILPEDKMLPRTASVAEMVNWARRSPWMELRQNPTYVRKGDIIRIGAASHVGIAAEDSDPATGKYRSIDGNGPKHNVAYRNRTCRGTAFAMSFNSTMKTAPPVGGVVQTPGPIPASGN